VLVARTPQLGRETLGEVSRNGVRGRGLGRAVDADDDPARKVSARLGEGVDAQLVAKIVDFHEDLPDEPVQALVSAAADADLVIVRSHGLKALGSVSERVAHGVDCSTLVVREPHLQREGEGQTR
jgi:nucleotide-binding universal stress UspA family protein